MALCPELFSLLKRQAKDGVVLLSSEGIPSSIRFQQGVGLVVDESGETYRINCPYCNDQRHRLYVNHRWTEYPHLIHCFNEQCMKDFVLRRNFYDRVMFDIPMDSRVLPVCDVPPPPPEDPNASVPLPGLVRRLDQLDPQDRCIRYLRDDRKFDIQELSRVYQVGACLQSTTYPAMSGRIFIPMFEGTRLRGWQGRYPEDLNWKESHLTKYYNLPRLRKSRFLYGGEAGGNHPFVILVEGVTDVWRIGSAARAYLGRELSSTQRRLVIEQWGHGTIVLMGDPDAVAENAHQAMLLEAEVTSLGGRVVNLELWDGVDPGKLTRDECWDLIEAITADRYCSIRRPY